MANFYTQRGDVLAIMSGATTTATGSWQDKGSAQSTLQAVVSGSGAVSATVVIDCSNDGVNACSTPLGVISISGTTSASDGFSTDAPWRFIRARVTAISGTGASVSVFNGV